MQHKISTHTVPVDAAATTKTSRLVVAFAGRLTLLLALSAAGRSCWAVEVYFDGSPSTVFQDATNWNPETAPGANLVDVYGIDDGLSSTYSGGNTRVKGLRVGSTSKFHQFGETHFGRLTMTGGSLEVIGSGAMGFFIVGREREPIIVDDDKKGGELILTGASTITANGVIVGERTLGLLSIGPQSLVDLRTWVTLDEPNHFGGTEDMRIGGYGPAYDDSGNPQPGLDGRGLVDVSGTLTAKNLYISEHGAKGEIRLSGGVVNLNGALIMDVCNDCVTNADLLALRSAQVTVVGSSGTFNVGLDPDPMVVDPAPPSRDLLAASPTAKFSFTADAGGVAPITIVDNPGEASGFASINSAKLELNLDAYTSTLPLTLINAPAGQLSGTFGTVSFLGTRTAAVHYDLVNGNVYLDSFQSAPPPGDFDLDGDVDGRDFLTWQRGFGRVGTGSVATGDANGDLNVNSVDLAIWRQNFGPAAVATTSATPEPSTLLLAVAAGVLGMTRRSRYR